MRLFFFGPRLGPIRMGMSFGPNDFRRRARPSTNPQSLSMPAFVYVLRGEHHRSKIGITNDPNRRLAQLSTASAFPLQFAYIGIAESNHAGNIEQTAHAILDRYRSNGEWFNCPPELAIAAVHGAAAQVGEKLCAVDPTMVDAIIGRALGEVQRQRPWWQIAIILAVLLLLGYLTYR